MCNDFSMFHIENRCTTCAGSYENNEFLPTAVCRALNLRGVSLVPRLVGALFAPVLGRRVAGGGAAVWLRGAWA
jgi:hypothetical protein